ncbi:MAG: glycosyltransferase [Candidatus Acidiferrum sp.]
MRIEHYILLTLAAIPFIYYSLAICSTFRFFGPGRKGQVKPGEFTPPVSCLKAIRGLDEGAYENFASFCRQDYPEYEIVFCVDENDPALPVIRRLIREYPKTQIRILFGPDHLAINDKVARLDRLGKEARYDVWVLTDGDVRVEPNYLRTVVAPLADPKTGGVTCFYSATKASTFTEKLQEVGMICDFFPGILVAWLLEEVKFGFGQTIVTTRARVQDFGGFRAIENRPADDLLVCRLIAESGYHIELLPHVVQTTPDFHSMKDLLTKRTRWITVMRRMRPWGHLGLVFTFGLVWSLLAFALMPSVTTAIVYLGGYLLFRVLLTWVVGVYGLKQHGLWPRMVLIPIWDAIAFLIWLASFTRRTIRWRGVDYILRDGTLQLITPERASGVSPQPES